MKRLVAWLGGITLFVVIFVGPRPLDDTHFSDAPYYSNTIDRLDEIRIDTRTGDYRAGYAAVDITPQQAIALGGYSGRQQETFTSIRTPLQAKVLSLSNGHHTISVINAEILLPLPDLVNAVVAKTEVPRASLFFTVTHTHSGPGGYQNNFIHEIALGKYSAKYLEQLSEKIASAVRQSRRELKSVALKHHRLTPEIANTLSHNSLDGNTPAYDAINVLALYHRDGSLHSLLTGFSAHPTILGRRNNELDGDYPNRVMATLEAHYRAPVMFSIGAPAGVQTMKRPKKTSLVKELESTDAYAGRFSEAFMRAFSPDAHKATQTGTLSSWLLDVELPPLQLLISDSLTLAPNLSQWLIHDRKSYIHTLHIDGFTFFGMPADYAGELARTLDHRTRDTGCNPWVHSFNGDYIGYLTPSDYFDNPGYATRDVNFFGRWGGDYFNQISLAICNKITASSSSL